MTKENALSLLKKIMKVESVLGGEKEVADILEAEFNKVGIETRQVPYSENRNNLIAILPGNNPGKNLAFSGHMDVVPVGDIEWNHPPFQARIEGNKLYGRGAVDMKSGLVAQALAMIEMKKANVSFNGNLIFLATVGEESSGLGAAQLVSEGYTDDIDAILIGEPTNNDVVVAHQGALWVKLVFRGKTGHSCKPEFAINSLDHAVSFINKFNKKLAPELRSHEDILIGNSSSCITVFNSGSAINVVPDLATLEVDIRTLKSQNHETIKAQIDNLIDELSNEIKNLDVTVKYTVDLSPMYTNPDNEFPQIVLSEANILNKDKKIIKGMQGYTDGSHFEKAKKDVDIIVCGPGDGRLGHQPNEHIDLDDFYQMINLNKNIAANYLNS